MQRNVTAYIFVSFMLCVSFNYTFPLHSDTTQHTTTLDSNRHDRCTSAPAGSTGWLEPARDSQTVDNFPHPIPFQPGPAGYNNLTGEDLRHYEQMVIMKKYPYLDLKDLELKFHSPSEKIVRQNPKYAVDRAFGNEPAISEPLEGPNVEIFNRGLSGFAIPQMKVTDARQATDVKDTKKSQILDSLREEIKEFEEKINKKG